MGNEKTNEAIIVAIEANRAVIADVHNQIIRDAAVIANKAVFENIKISSTDDGSYNHDNARILIKIKRNADRAIRATKIN